MATSDEERAGREEVEQPAMHETLIPEALTEEARIGETLLEETLDRDDVPLHEVRKALSDLRRVDLWLFGWLALRSAWLPRILALGHPRQMALDIGAGGGHGPMALVRAAARRGVELRVVSLDRKLNHLLTGRSRGGVGLAVVADAGALPFSEGSIDWAISTLFFHHLDARAKRQTIEAMVQAAREAVVIVDLRPSVWADRLVRVLFPLLGFSRISIDDGLMSIRQSWEIDRWREILDGLQVLELRRRFPTRVTLVVDAH